MSSAKRMRPASIDSESDHDANEESLSVSTTGTARHRTSHRFCPHCCEVVSHKTYRFHKRLYYDKVRYYNIRKVTASSRQGA